MQGIRPEALYIINGFGEFPRPPIGRQSSRFRPLKNSVMLGIEADLQARRK